jgi:dolichyl-phosphate beta-glucosyltransferase
VRWSVVIPAFNEARRLPPYLEEVLGFFDGRGEPYEVLVADDGSTDSTVAAVRALGARHPALRVLPLGRNRGKGAAVRAGMLAATGAYRLFADADGATPIAELKRLEPALLAGADVAIGSRVLVDPAVAVRTRAHRVAVGRLFNWLVARLGLRGIADSQCGFKAFRADAARAIFSRQRIDGFGFDVEVLYLARRLGFGVRVVPLRWEHKENSRVAPLRDTLLMLSDVLGVRLNAWRGVYDEDD